MFDPSASHAPPDTHRERIMSTTHPNITERHVLFTFTTPDTSVVITDEEDGSETTVTNYGGRYVYEYAKSRFGHISTALYDVDLDGYRTRLTTWSHGVEYKPIDLADVYKVADMWEDSGMADDIPRQQSL